MLSASQYACLLLEAVIVSQDQGLEQTMEERPLNGQSRTIKQPDVCPDRTGQGQGHVWLRALLCVPLRTTWNICERRFPCPIQLAGANSEQRTLYSTSSWLTTIFILQHPDFRP